MAQLAVTAVLAAAGNAAGTALAASLSYGAIGTGILSGLGGAVGAGLGSLLAPATKVAGPRLGELTIHADTRAADVQAWSTS